MAPSKYFAAYYDVSGNQEYFTEAYDGSGNRHKNNYNYYNYFYQEDPYKEDPYKEDYDKDRFYDDNRDKFEKNLIYMGIGAATLGAIVIVMISMRK